MGYRLTIIFLLFWVSFSFGGSKVVKHILPNGAVIIYKETSGEGIIAGSIFIKGGSIEDPKQKKGLTNLTMVMLLKGSKNYSSFEINSHFEDSGGYISTSTDEEYSILKFALRTQDFAKGMEIIRDILFNPVFPEDRLEIEKRTVISKIRAKREEGISYAFDNLRKLIYKDTPYQYSPLGTEEGVSKVFVKDLKKRWKQLLQSGRFVVSIVGDMPYSEAEKYIKQVFSDIPKHHYQIPEYYTSIKGKLCKTFHREGAQATILVGYDAPPFGTEDYFPMKVLNGILGDGFTSRLFQRLREEEGLAYAVGSFLVSNKNMGRYVAYIETSPDNTKKALEGIVKTVRSVEKGISPEEIQTAKEKIIGSFLLSHQTRASQSYYLGKFEVLGVGYEMDKKYPQLIEAVSQQDIYRVWKEYIPKGYRCVIVKP
ncbi:MAG: insulinase family protein [Aquificae bacterium]|nr:insulinase family protein [Aquificota bacterium]